ncbi:MULTISPECIES: IclR family transcriptional regulator domain-containing protein [Rhodococcus]|uniref:IclR family transcriptional regulator domain-containing protein n=1 Tax=Rhodococcus TaxID=1827 RepID=UPI001FF34F31|nr:MULTISPECIES: IclR family transcriptional regulator C-terminal domain-containing protein [Rhodococcus]MDI9933888.1 IclR family transcriptional regulator C-terminal domain-containing protein [Rhodococcus sp. IEGM 1351]MDV6240625.1 IclR family transcriptional regulator C-terminal domain-containing protein [Rhodococcus opacus]MDX5963219.1 IclR family transcriptional regulator C-terminal domain-containing protein [Rhodococcus opacus]UOT06090.1 hypothetical protein MPY17_10250 [Rhodococcus opacus
MTSARNSGTARQTLQANGASLSRRIGHTTALWTFSASRRIRSSHSHCYSSPQARHWRTRRTTSPGRSPDVDDLVTELGEVRNRGWALEREQGTVGVVCIATVVPYRIPATDALSVSMPAEVASYPGELERIAGVLTKHASAWARELRAEGVR